MVIIVITNSMIVVRSVLMSMLNKREKKMGYQGWECLGRKRQN